MANPDIVIIGSGIGGATIAAGLAGSGASILILERGERLPTTPETRDTRAIFQRGHFRPKETWREAGGEPFNPGNYYYVGGNSKFYGAVLIRYRKEDFAELEHLGGVSPAWPFPYDELEPWYRQAEQLFRVRGDAGRGPDRAVPLRAPIPFRRCPTSRRSPRARAELKALGLHPASLPLGVDIDALAGRRARRLGCLSRHRHGKMDAETAALAAALTDPNIQLETGAHVDTSRGSADGKTHRRRSTTARTARRRRLSPKLVVLSAGAVNSAAILLRSATAQWQGPRQPLRPGRPQLHEPQLRRAMLAIDPRRATTAVYQKT